MNHFLGICLDSRAEVAFICVFFFFLSAPFFLIHSIHYSCAGFYIIAMWECGTDTYGDHHDGKLEELISMCDLSDI